MAKASAQKMATVGLMIVNGLCVAFVMKLLSFVYVYVSMRILYKSMFLETESGYITNGFEYVLPGDLL